ncbi:hypothetical protein L1987_21541 [Smallanthus sonchifolius]|uniref:Uncharacterized protein n=1 Tax=Smallanthus sonchifolius TaxID=185202 RepID=A0ACB9IU60_9ASTR|nr:hypothetical protein L1987_21541 [Smallanthus sonchifolius]
MSNTAKKACLFSYWTVFVYNGIKDPITVHVQSGDDDLGNHTLALNDNENWSFCEGATFKTLFYAHFYWNSKTILFDVFDDDTSEKYCAKWKFRKERRCFWLVREDGFYLGAQLNPFPEGWTKLHDWSFSDDELRNNAAHVVTCNDQQREIVVPQNIDGKQIDRVFTFDKAVEVMGVYDCESNCKLLSCISKKFIESKSIQVIKRFTKTFNLSGPTAVERGMMVVLDHY